MGILSAVRVTAAVLVTAQGLPGAVLAQDAKVPLPPEGMVQDARTMTTGSQTTLPLPPGVENPHEVLGELNGGPAGSPTALRGNPLPGTSTSIPTANPAPVLPLPERQGQVAERENTGIEGQCDPVVGLGNCRELFEEVGNAAPSAAEPSAAQAAPEVSDAAPSEAGGGEKTEQ